MSEEMATSSVEQNKYRSYLSGEEVKNIKWRFGGPPDYSVVNKLFEEGRTKVWSLAPYLSLALCVCVCVYACMRACVCAISISLDHHISTLICKSSLMEDMASWIT